MQNIHSVPHVMHQINAHSDMTRVVSITPRHIALFHLKQFAKMSMVVAATIIVILYSIAIILDVPTVIR
ncbi:MAG: hypothetical protein FJ040_08100 [Chloroflexi bacterium]|nr:hypothetical protein [Chloroflexota bacterium]